MAPKKKGKAMKTGTVVSRQVVAPAATGTTTQMRSINVGTYAETERVGTVLGSTGFLVAGNFPVNPALPGLFPWLSNHATLYDKYRFRKLIFRYKTTRGSNSIGNISMAFDSDAIDPIPASMMEMTQSAVSTASASIPAGGIVGLLEYL